MADRGYNLASFVCVLHEFQDRRVSPQIVGAVTTRDNHCIEGRRLYLIGGGIYLYLEPALTLVHFTGAGADDYHVRARLSQPYDRIPQLQILEEILSQHRDPLPR